MGTVFALSQPTGSQVVTNPSRGALHPGYDPGIDVMFSITLVCVRGETRVLTETGGQAACSRQFLLSGGGGGGAFIH